MKLKNYGLFLASLGLLASCANDNVDGPKQEIKGDVAFSFNVKEVGSRADGEQVTATPAESNVDKVTILMEQNGKLVPFVASKAGSVWKFMISGTAFTNLNSSEGTFYAVANPANIDFSDGKLQKVIEGTNYATNNQFLMSSTQATKVVLDLEGMKNGKYTEENPYNIGTLPVRRTVARIDVANAQPEAALDVEVKFQGASLVNLSNNFYLYQQVGGNVFGNVATDATWIDDPKVSASSYDFSKLINRVTADQHPQDLTYTAAFPGGDNYQTLSYVNPNTVTSINDQVNGKSTGVVFKAEITAKEGQTLNVAEGEDLCVYYGKVIGGETYIKGLASSSNADQKNLASVYTNAVAGLNDAAAKRAALREAGFEVYPAKDNKYFCYYYYWVRHNILPETFNNGEMHDMEFGVVRNHVYRIAVNSVTGLGKPGDFNPNPDQVDDPKVEEPADNAFIQVTLQVMPWVTVYDNIEF